MDLNHITCLVLFRNFANATYCFCLFHTCFLHNYVYIGRKLCLIIRGRLESDNVYITSSTWKLYYVIRIKDEKNMFCGSRHFLSICCCLPALCTHAVKRNEWFSKCFRVSKMSSSATLFCTSPKKIMLRFKKLTDHATAPSKGSPFAAGYDLYSAYDYVIPASGKELVKTDLQICVPADTYGRIAPRSGLAHKNFIDVGAGVVDHDYRGNVGVILFNFGKADFIVKKGDRVAQLICERIHYPELEEVKELDDTDRGENGFGSTGTK